MEVKIMKTLSVFLCAVVFVLGFVGSANAFLYDRGNGLIYDSAQNITWMQDANLAATEEFGGSDISSYGSMSWDTAQDWIAAMNAADYMGYDDWRLPTTVDGPNVYEPGMVNYYDGTATAGYNITTSEMGYMYYVNLGNLGEYDTAGNLQSGSGLLNTSYFNNVKLQDYWSGTECSLLPGQAWVFEFGTGKQGDSYKYALRYAWPVRDGDSVPIPSAVWLLGSGMIGVVGFRKYRKV
jgi:hypothetical protein